MVPGVRPITPILVASLRDRPDNADVATDDPRIAASSRIQKHSIKVVFELSEAVVIASSTDTPRPC